jgi:DivIVA domain-containing protein
VWVLLAILVLGGVAVVAAGRGEGLTAPQPDRPDLSIPPDRPLGRTDVDMLRFSVGLRGYRMDEVDDVLDRLAYDLEARDARIAILEQEVAARMAVPVAASLAMPSVAARPESTPRLEQRSAPDQPTKPDPTAGHDIVDASVIAAEESIGEDIQEEDEAEDAFDHDDIAVDDAAPDDAAPDDAAAEDAGAEADEVEEVDEGDLLVGRTLIVPFQQTDGRFTSGDDDHPDPDAAGGDGPGRGA